MDDYNLIIPSEKRCVTCDKVVHEEDLEGDDLLVWLLVGLCPDCQETL